LGVAAHQGAYLMLRHLRYMAIGVFVGIGAAASLHAQQDDQPVMPGVVDGEENPYFLGLPDASKFFVIIAGAAASEEIGERFEQWAGSLRDILLSDYDYSGENIVLLLGDGSAANPAVEPDASSRRSDIERHLSALQAQMRPGDQV